MADISRLLSNLRSWNKGRKALEELATLPLETKRAKVYPRVVALAIEFWGDPEKGGSGYEVENFVKFIIPELAVEPDLANMVFVALREEPLQVRPEHFYKLVAESRDKRAIPLLRGMWKTHAHHWIHAVLGSDARELADDVVEHLAAHPSWYESELPITAGLIGGATAIAQLKKLAKTIGGDSIALGLALAGHDDAKYFKDISRAREGQTAKRLYAALHEPKQKDRLAALDAFQKEIEKPKAWVTTGMLLAFSRMLAAEDAVVVARAAELIWTYVKDLAPYMKNKPEPYHAYFLASAQHAITRGVSPEVRSTLDRIRKSIPCAAPFAKGIVVEAAQPELDPKIVAREAAAREKLLAMGVDLSSGVAAKVGRSKPAPKAKKR